MESLIKPIVFSSGVQLQFNKQDDNFVINLSGTGLDKPVNLPATDADLQKLVRAISVVKQVASL